MSTTSIVSVAVPVPLRRSFHYIWPSEFAQATVGLRVVVPFGQRELIGIVIETHVQLDEAVDNLKPVQQCLDSAPILSENIMTLMQWASDYYHYPVGETLHVALPNALRKGLPLQDLSETTWQLKAGVDVESVSARAVKQRELIAYLLEHQTVNENKLKELSISKAVVKSALTSDLLEEKRVEAKANTPTIHSSPHSLNEEQAAAVSAFKEKADAFHIGLLEGVTGSGKTEVYLRMIAHCLEQGRQALVLVPEIGLTPQTLTRFKQRFDCPMAIFHSSLTDLQRLKYWQQAKSGYAKIIIGTRSAIFTDCENLGLIVIDEEHDLSYKQQDGLRYSARDLACMRAKLEDISIILGSATPTLESLHNAQTQKYQHWQLWQRAGEAKEPEVALLDVRRQPMYEGLAENTLQEVRECLERQEQVLLFINRRGFAPSLICHDCAWVSQCVACDARMTVHQQTQQLRCHHCGMQDYIPHSCPNCQSRNLIRTGIGTERLEIAMRQLFPDTPLFRIDRDTTSHKNALENMVDEIQQQEAAILIGTQMLAKGHHFPNVTLVVIVDADASLVSTDYRAMERFGQLLTQVAGRAGRESKAGKAIIQTHYPKHPQLEKLIHWGYHRFAMDLLAQRQATSLPPFSAQALIRLEDRSAEQAEETLLALKHVLQGQPCITMGPMPASLQRRAYYFRYQLLVQSQTRGQLKHAIEHLLKYSDKIVKPNRQRWSIDIDPQDMS